MMETLSSLAFHVTNGVIWGVLVALIALGLALIYGIMRIVNLAHGDLFMVGAVLTVVLGGWLGSFWPMLLLAPLVVGLLAIPLERWVLRPFEGKVLVTLVATVGLSYIIQQLVLMTFGGAPVRIAPPLEFSMPLFGSPFPGYRLFAAGMGLLIIGGLWFLVYRTRFGIYLRATVENPSMAEALGIDTSRVRQLTFGLGAGLAAVAGVLAAPVHSVFFLMGREVLLFSFIVVIIGGLQSLPGAFIVAVALSGVEGGLNAFLNPVHSRALILLLMALVLVFRPRGIFG